MNKFLPLSFRRKFLIKILAFFLCGMVLIPQIVVGQGEPEMKIDEAMDSMLDSHPYRFSIFWVMPDVNVHSGYDSNALHESGETNGDYFFSVAPGGSFGLRFGSRAFLVIDEYINFLYYNELDQLRDIFNRTSARFVTGSRRTLLTARGSYVNRKTGVDSEFDVPVQQKSSSAGTDLDVSIATKWDLGFHFNSAQNLYEVVDPSNLLSLPPDYRNYRYGNSIKYKVRPTMAIVANATFGRTEFVRQNRSGDTLRFLGGLDFSSPTIAGQVRFGYGQTKKDNRLNDVNIQSWLANGNVTFTIRERATLGLFVRQDHDISRIGSGNFRISTEGGVRGTIPMGQKMFFDGNYRIANNDYGERPDVGGGVLSLNDTIHFVGFGINYHVLRNLIVRGGGIYYNRDSNFRPVEKDRFAYDLGINYVVNP